MKKTMSILFIALLGILSGVIIDRYYILNHIKKDIELNSKEEYRTPLNDEYTEKKVYMYNYLIREFVSNNQEKDLVK